MSNQDFAERHAQIDADPVVELRRRLQFWACCPGSDGGALKPDAQIVPIVTLQAAVAELEEWRRIAEGIKGAKMRGNA